MYNDTKLAEMLCTRLCHDLTGPIGAVNNGAEFLEEEGFDMQHEAMQLILSSAAEAVHRLQFYRQAYGRLNDGGEASLAQQKGIVEDFFSTTKITIDWPDSHADGAQVSISQKMSRLILNYLIIMSGVLIKGGKVSLRLYEDASGAKQVDIEGEGPMVKVDEDIMRVLRKEAQLTQLSPKTAQIALTLKIAEEVGASVTISHNAETFKVGISQQAVVLSESSHSYA